MYSTIYVDNDNVAEVIVLNPLTQQYVNDADAAITLLDSNGDEVAGQVWPTTMDYVPASDGIYRAILKAAVALVRADTYQAIITVDTTAGVTSKLVCDLKAAVRSCASQASCR